MDFPSGHPPEYYPRLSLVNFIERTGYGSLRLIWPIILLNYAYCINNIIPSGCTMFMKSQSNPRMRLPSPISCQLRMTTKHIRNVTRYCESTNTAAKTSSTCKMNHQVDTSTCKFVMQVDIYHSRLQYAS